MWGARYFLIRCEIIVSQNGTWSNLYLTKSEVLRYAQLPTKKRILVYNSRINFPLKNIVQFDTLLQGAHKFL